VSIEVQIAAVDQFSATAQKASAALAQIADREKNLVALSEKLGVSQKQVVRALSEVDKQQRASESAARSAIRKREQEERKALSEAAKQQKDAERAARAAARKKEQDERKASAAQKQQLESMKKAAGYVVAITTAVVAAGAAAVGLAVNLAHAASEAARGASEARALMHGLTGGQGARALELVDQLAGQLGVQFEEAREQFTRFREAGASNTMSANLIRARADLVAFGLSAEAADAEIQKVLSARGNGAQSAALQEIREAYEGVGSGALAAAHASTSAEGAMSRIQNVAARELEELWERIGPNVDRAATAVANFVESFAKSAEGRAALDSIVTGFRLVTGAAETSVSVIERLLAIVRQSRAALSGLTGEQDGRNTAAGFTRGFSTGGERANQAAANFADRFAAAFRERLGIQSPSRLFAQFGAYTVQGFEQGQEREMPDSFPLEERAAEMPARQVVRNESTTTNTTSTAVSSGISIENLNVYGASGSPDDVALAVRRELQRMTDAMRLSRGLT
jgi:hypothetical protein